MDLARMTITDIEALLRLLAEMKRKELELIIRKRREAERQGRQTPRILPGFGH